MNTATLLLLAFSWSCFPLLYLIQSCRGEVFNVSEYAALQSFYAATNGDAWTYSTGDTHWNFSDLNPCLPTPWVGLTCNPSNVSVTEITLNGYNLTGTLPADIFINLTELTTFNIGFNNITGTIPGTIESLSKLQVLQVYNNKFSGTIPDILWNMSTLVKFGSLSNYMEGSIPETVGNLVNLINFNVGQNKHDGTIPHSMSNLKLLKQFDMSNNRFTGSIPESITSLEDISIFVLNFNLLTGTIPESIGNMKQLEYLHLEYNKLTGTIPTHYAVDSQIQHFVVSNNELVGTIPSALGAISQMTMLDLGNNYFTGSVPLELFENMTKLEQIYLNKNFLTGPIPNVASINLEIYDISNNQFDGVVPHSIFQLPNLTSFSSSVNCITAKLPQSICYSSSLLYLHLSGMHQGQNCKSSLSTCSHVPDCIWSMRSLRRLYIAGNSFCGSMNGVQLNNLTHLSIGYNQFHGTIPTFFNDRRMEVFDISHNFITGTLYDVNILPMSSDSQFRTKLNRLSGPLNTKVIEEFVKAVSILQGGVFSCETIPDNDTNKSYICGSIGFNYSLIYFGSFFFVFVCLLFWFSRVKYESIVEIYNNWTLETSRRNLTLDNEVKENFPHTMYILNSLDRLRKACIVICTAVFVIGIVLYSSLKYTTRKYSSYYYQYEYILSGVFLTSEIPASILLIFHLFVNISIVYIFARIFDFDWRVMHLHARRSNGNDSVNHAGDNIGNDEAKDQNYALSWRLKEKLPKRVYQATMLSAFLAIPMGLNILYIAVAGQLPLDTLVCVQLFLLTCNAGIRIALPVVVPNLFRKKGSRYHNFASVFFLAGLLSFVDIAVPFAATLLQSDLCFNQYLPGAEPKPVTIDEAPFEMCSAFWTNGSCYVPSRSYIPNQISFVPPIVFSRECRDAVLRNYLPLVIYACAFSAFVMPVIHFLLSFRMYDLRKEVVIFGHPFKAGKFVLPDLNYLIIIIWGDFLLLLTYGIISPYATLAIGANIYSQIYTARISVCRYYYLQFHHLKDRTLVEHNHNHLENICENCQRHIHAMLWPGMVIGSSLFGLYVFEMAMDSERPTVVPFILMGCTIASVPFAVLAYRYLRNRTQQFLETRLDSTERDTKNPITVNMSTISNSSISSIRSDM